MFHYLHIIFNIKHEFCYHCTQYHNAFRDIQFCPALQLKVGLCFNIQQTHLSNLQSSCHPFFTIAKRDFMFEYLPNNTTHETIKYSGTTCILITKVILVVNTQKCILKQNIIKPVYAQLQCPPASIIIALQTRLSIFFVHRDLCLGWADEQTMMDSNSPFLTP